MNMPGFTAEVSLYQTNNHYRVTAGGSFLSVGNATVTPQDCGWIKGGLCGFVIAGGVAACPYRLPRSWGRRGLLLVLGGLRGVGICFLQGLYSWMDEGSYRCR